MIRVYLAGHEVFLPDAVEIGEQKKRICAARGCVGVYPLDHELPLDGLSGPDAAYAIYTANREAMDSCTWIIANLTPFRGASADAGTVFELGYMRGAGKPVLAYSNVTEGYADRARRLDPGAHAEPGGVPCDGNGMEIECFGLADNLMLEGALRDGDMQLITNDIPTARRFTDLTAFEACVDLIGETVAASPGFAANRNSGILAR